MANKEELLARLKEEKPAMEVRDLSFAYGENQILKDISLMIKRQDHNDHGCERMWKINVIFFNDKEFESKPWKSFSSWKEHQEFKS